MKFRVQICCLLLLIAIVASTVVAQTSAEKDPRTSRVVSPKVPTLLIPELDSTGAVGLANTAAKVNSAASKERKRGCC